MSEHETEQPIETETDTAPDDDETGDHEVAEGDETGDETGDEQPGPASTGDAEIDALYTKLGTKAKNYFKGVGELLAGSGVPVEPCEMCADCYPGLRWQVPQDETHATMLAVVGAAGGESPLPLDPDARQCERCKGWGAVTLPTHVPGNEQRVCKACNGAGYLDPNPQSGAMQPPAPETPNGETELLPGVQENDPSVIDLRARGYTIIPPMRIPQSVEG